MKAAEPTPRSMVRPLLAQLAKRVRAAEKSPDDPDSVHDLRVSIRHFHQAMRILPQMFDRRLAKSVKRRLKKVMSLLGALRNRDIAPEILQAAGVTPDEALLKKIQKDRRSAQKQLARQLESWRKQEILREWKTKMHKSAGGAPALKNARLELAGLAGELFQAGDYAVNHKVPYSRLHACRLLAKRLRYSMEMFQLNGSTRFKSRFKTLKRLQDQLGALNDCVTVLELVEGHATAKGRLRLLRMQREKAFRAFWKQNFDTHTQDGWLHELISQKASVTRKGRT
jgi:CHAD domain-containing protein